MAGALPALCLAPRLAICLALFSTGPAVAQDFALTNARVYTLDPAQPWADTVVVKDGRIAAVFNEPTAPADADMPVFDLQGAMVLPGFQDTHAHLASGGVAYTGCPVFDLGSLEAVLAAIRACAEAQPGRAVIRGKGWTMDLAPEGAPPSRKLLDDIDNSRPLVFKDADGHALWVNSRALEAYGIDALTPDPPGGHIARESGSRTPRGTLHETAMDLVQTRLPPFADADLARGIRYGQDYFHSLGITAFQEALVRLEPGTDYSSLPAFAALAKSGELKLRTSLALRWTPGAGLAQLPAQEAPRTKHAADRTGVDPNRFRVNMVKLWADGVVETRTARLLEPYTDDPDTRGLMMIAREELVAAIPALDAAGFQVHVHAIGDATARYALDGFAAARAANGGNDLRHHVNHVQFVHPDDIGRFAALGVAASFEPLWAYEETYITELTRPRVGPERIRWTYPIRSILDSGARVAFSSDWSVSSADPLLGIETAITRQSPFTDTGEPFLPEQAVTLAQAIAAYTRDAAWLNHFDAVSGTIEPGKAADLVVLDRDLFAIPVHDISQAKVVATLFEGEVVYGALPGH